MKIDREFIADMFIRGEGIEIGALDMPLRVPRSAKVKYVDRLRAEDLRKQYPKLNDKQLVQTDIIADGEKLESLADSTQDFVIANHFVAHGQDPLVAVLNMLRVLKPGGILYLAVPVHSWTPFEMLELILALREKADFEIALCFRHDSVEMIFVLRKSPLQTTGRLATAFDRALSPEPWCVDDITYDGNTLEMSGWALAPKGRHDLLTFTINDREFEERMFPLPRPDLASIFWFKEGADRAGFRCRLPIKREELFRDGFATLKCIDRATGLPIREEYNMYYADDADGPELPDAERRQRVSGTDSALLFRLEGFSIFKKLDLALRRTMSKPLSEFRDILDWGCRCGRVTRYFYLLPSARVVGTDIDGDDVNWCRAHFKFGEYHAAPLHPPTDFEAERFDLIIGIPGFSQLREKDQQEWLAELSRIARPGAALLMSTMGEATVGRSSWSEDLWSRWQETGFLAGANTADIGGENYYVNAYMTEDYIRRSWSGTFEILDFIPACIGNHQDLVVMRKPIR